MVGTQNYFDPDGLFRKFGTDKAIPNIAGEYRYPGEFREIEIKLDLTTLTSTSTIISDTTYMPKGAFIEEVVLDVTTAATSGGSPTLDVGLIQTDRSTVTSNTSFIAAEVLSGVLDTAGKKVTYTAGVSKAGAAIGTTLSATLVNQISARANTATFTAGVVMIRIRFRML